MVIWQVFAGVVAFALVATAVRLLRKRPWPSQIVVVFPLVPIPAAGFAVYALNPGSLPTVALATWVGSVLLALAIYPAFWGLRDTNHKRASAVTFEDIASVNRHSLAWRGCAVLGVTVYLFMFEPWFALTNLVAIAAWVALSIPTARRRRGRRSSSPGRACSEAMSGWTD